MASAASVSNEVWHTNLGDVPVITGSFIENFARENLPIKASLSRGYRFFHESFVHDTEG